MPPVPVLLRVVVDTNLIVRAVLSPTGAGALLLQAIRRQRCLLITSREHLAEINRVLSRPRFVQRYGVTRAKRQRLISRLYARSSFVTPVGHLRLCRDPKDDYLIEMALLGQADFLVSEDDDLHSDADIVELLRRNHIQLVRVGTIVQALDTR